jgi:hypothetical protein
LANFGKFIINHLAGSFKRLPFIDYQIYCFIIKDCQGLEDSWHSLFAVVLSAVSLIRCQWKYTKIRNSRTFPRLFAIFDSFWHRIQSKIPSFWSVQYSLIIRGFRIRSILPERIYRELRGPPLIFIELDYIFHLLRLG